MTGSISFASAFVAGRNRVPSPATGKTAVRTRFVTVSPRRSKPDSARQAILAATSSFTHGASHANHPGRGLDPWHDPRHPRPTQVYSNPSDRIGPGS